MKKLIYFFFLLLLLSIVSAKIIVEQGVYFEPSGSTVSFRALEEFDVAEITITSSNLTMDNITYESNESNTIVINFSISSVLKKFLNTNESIAVNLTLDDLRTDEPYNDVYNTTSEGILAYNQSVYGIIIGPDNEIRVGYYLNTTIPSEDRFNLYFKVDWNKSDQLIYSLGFNVNSTNTVDVSSTGVGLYTELVVNSSIGIISAPSVLSQWDSGSYYEDMIRSYFGNVPALPTIYERDYSFMFMLNLSNLSNYNMSDELASIPINISYAMENYAENWTQSQVFNNLSLMLTAGSIYGGINEIPVYDYEIPFYVGEYSR